MTSLRRKNSNGWIIGLPHLLLLDPTVDISDAEINGRVIDLDEFGHQSLNL